MKTLATIGADTVAMRATGLRKVEHGRLNRLVEQERSVCAEPSADYRRRSRLWSSCVALLVDRPRRIVWAAVGVYTELGWVEPRPLLAPLLPTDPFSTVSSSDRDPR
jgi:hypothetical protein